MDSNNLLNKPKIIKRMYKIGKLKEFPQKNKVIKEVKQTIIIVLLNKEKILLQYETIISSSIRLRK